MIKIEINVVTRHIFKNLSNEELGKVIKALMKYYFDDEQTEFENEKTQFAYTLFVDMVFEQDRRFYVYEWYNIETDDAFYVGKGTKNRMYNKRERNENFKYYLQNNDCDVRKIKDNLNETEALEYENFVIKHYCDKGVALTNINLVRND